MHKKRNVAHFFNTLPLSPRLFVSPIKVSPSDQNRIETTEQPSFAWKAIPTTYNHTPSFSWKAIPSEARVTRDEVSGLQPHDKRLSGRQYQLMHYELCIMNYAL